MVLPLPLFDVQRILSENSNNLEIHWISAHEGVWGNGLADAAAKRATGWRPDGTRGEDPPRPPDLKSLTAARKAMVHKEATDT